jgi:arylsulfatase A-like enzyme
MSNKNKQPKITRRQFTQFSAGGVAASFIPKVAAKSQQSHKRPNVIFIMADDLGYGDVSAFGRPDYETPVIDQLTKDGLKLTNTYANSAVCSPTRTALLTGNYQYRLRVGLEEPLAGKVDGIPNNHPTMARVFKSAGYNTALVGKWHLGEAPDFGPLKAGYDHFFGFYPGGVDYFAHKIMHGKVKLGPPSDYDGLWRDDKEPVQVDGYMTDIIGDETQGYIDALTKEDDPFFISMHFSAPHWPWEGPNDVRLSKDLTSILHLDGGNAKVYAEMVKSLDANIGRTLKKLNDLGLSENTIIVFTSDNGGERFSYNWPFLGKKGELLEGGIRVPGIVRWPKAIKPGSTSKQVITSMDWMPTLMAAAGIKPMQLDGHNLLESLINPNKIKERELYWRFKASEQAAVRSGDWKYLKLKEEEFLFNLAEDQREQANLKKVHPSIFKDLKNRYAQWNDTMLQYPEDSFSHSTEGLYTDRY